MLSVIFFIVMLNIVVLSVTMQNAIMLLSILGLPNLKDPELAALIAQLLGPLELFTQVEARPRLGAVNPCKSQHFT